MDPDKLFLVMEISAVALMYGVINFSNYFVDLSPVLAFGLAFYAVIKTIQITGRNSHLVLRIILQPLLSQKI